MMFVLALILGIFGRASMGYFSEAVNVYAEALIINYSREVIDQGVASSIIEDLNGESLLKQSYDSNGKVSYAYLDAQKVNKIRTNTSKYVAEAIQIINQQESFQSIEIPLGYFFGRNYFLANGVRVPIDLEVVGKYQAELQSNIENYGLNTTILEISLYVCLEIQSVIPFQEQKIITEMVIPLSLEIMNNDIPYYLGDILK